MATYAQLYDAVTQAGPVLNRAIVAVAFAAQKVLVENPAILNHDVRLAWARKAIRDPKTMALQMAYAIASDANVSTKANAVLTDLELQAAVDVLVDAFALV